LTYNVRIGSCRLRSDGHQGSQDLEGMAGWAGANQVDARLIFWLKKIDIFFEMDFQFSTIILKRHLFNNNTL
jgi:hypothetical protein